MSGGVTHNIMGRGLGPKAKIQEAILRGRGLDTPKPRRTLAPAGGMHTLAMRLLEVQFDSTIEDLIKEGTIANIAGKLGIDESTVSLWRLKLGLRTKGSTI